MRDEFKPEAIAQRAADENRSLLCKLNEQLTKTNAEHAFVSYVLSLLGRWWGAFDEKGWNDPEPALIEFAAFQLFPHFENTQVRDPAAIQSIIDLLEEMRKNRTFEIMFSAERAPKPGLADIVMHLSLYREGVRGSAYPDQTKAEIEGIQVPFEEWFQQRVGIGPRRAIVLIDSIHDQMMRNRDEARTAISQGIFSDPESQQASKSGFTKQAMSLVGQISMALPDAIPVTRGQLVWMSEPPTAEEWSDLITLVGLTPGKCSSLAAPSDVKAWPLFVLPNERIFFFDFSCVYDELFNAFDRKARSDRRFYDRHYLKNQTNWMENEIGLLLKRVFPADNVFASLLYPDPDRPGGEAELDAAVKWGPFLILVEGKGCQFRSDVIHSDLGRLRTDIEKNVAEAFDQAQRASRYIASVPAATFREKHGARTLQVSNAEVRRVFKLSVTLHHLADLTTQLANLQALNLFTSGDYPFSVSLGDLSIITRFSEGPDVFLHYVQRRLDLQRSGKNIQGDELDIFGLYLDSRLDPSQFWERKDNDGKDFTMMTLTGGSERFDRWKNAELGIGLSPEIALTLPPEVKAILSELRRREDDGARWIAFSILSLSHDGIQRLAHLVTQIRRNDLNLGRVRSALFVDGNVLAVLTAGQGNSGSDLREVLVSRVASEKYRRRLETALGFTFQIDNPLKPFDFAVWLEGAWEHDPELEKLIRESPALKVLPGQKLPGRNDRCVCGSGKKFKKCCLPFFGRKQQPDIIEPKP